TFSIPPQRQSITGEETCWKALYEQTKLLLEQTKPLLEEYRSRNRYLSDLVEKCAEELDEHALKEELLEIQVDQHKETLAEIVRDNSDKDYVIATQEFLLGAARDEAEDLGKCVLEKNGLLAALQASEQYGIAEESEPQTKKRRLGY
ncbi:hypothetical protein Micbo1qcDRAFT_170078, partial [Microdochium bolleyi]